MVEQMKETIQKQNDFICHICNRLVNKKDRPHETFRQCIAALPVDSTIEQMIEEMVPVDLFFSEDGKWCAYNPVDGAEADTLGAAIRALYEKWKAQK